MNTNSVRAAALGILTGAALMLPGTAQSKPLNAKCLLVIDGVTRMSSKCSFTSDSDSDSFSDERLLIVCPNGKSVQYASCYGYEQRVARNGVFGYLFRAGNSGRLCWNNGNMRKASPCFAGLKRSGACWESASAEHVHAKTRHRVKFCAWAV